jgi:hypothetical protein
MHKETTPKDRSALIVKWREFCFESGAEGEEARLISIIGAAYLRLARLDGSNPEIAHAKQLLECAMTCKLAMTDGICRRQGTGAKKPARGGLLAGPD